MHNRTDTELYLYQVVVASWVAQSVLSVSLFRQVVEIDRLIDRNLLPVYGVRSNHISDFWRWQFCSVSNTCVEQLNGLITPGQLQRKKPGMIPERFFMKFNGYWHGVFSTCG